MGAEQDVKDIGYRREFRCKDVIEKHPRKFGDKCIYLRGKRDAYKMVADAIEVQIAS